MTLIPGDGSGPELVRAAVRVLEATDVDVEWDLHHLVQSKNQPGQDGGAPELNGLPGPLLQSLVSSGVALKGPMTISAGNESGPSPNRLLKQAAKVFAQARSARFLGGGAGARPGVDIVVMREMTEDLYAGIEFRAGGEETEILLRSLPMNQRGKLGPEPAVALKPVSAARSRKFLEHVFWYAEREGRKKVTVLHKATVLPATDGLFLEVARDVAREHGSVELDERLVDTACAELVRSPERYDVIATMAQYGDLISDLAAALVGGVGVMAGVNYGDAATVFEAAHGSAPRHAGSGRLDPIALILSGAMLLRHIEEHEAAEIVEEAVFDVVSEGRTLTYDLAGSEGGSSTEAVTDAIVGRVASLLAKVPEAPG